MSAKQKRKPIVVLAAGVFDILHLGHIHYLTHAKSLGDELVVVVATDEIARKSGKLPVHKEKDRFEMIKSLRMVDRAILGDKRDMLKTLKKVHPDIVFLGYDQELAPPLLDYCVKHGIRIMKDACTLNPKRYKTTVVKERIMKMHSSSGITEMTALAKKNVQHCPWCRTVSSEDYVRTLEEEVEELLGAFKNKDYENVREEIGDVIWDALVLAHICEREGKFKSDDVIDGIIKKIKRRKPFLEENREVTLEEAKRLWDEAKRAEKKNKKMVLQ